MTIQELHTLVERLLLQHQENEYIEFKDSNQNPEEIGKRISALSNSATLQKQPYGYLLYGIEDGTQKAIGTNFKPSKTKEGTNELENWLTQLLSPRLDFRIYEFEYQGVNLVLFHIPATVAQPIKFKNIAYIRVGSITRELKELPEKERKIWLNETQSSFEQEPALKNVSAADVIQLLDTQWIFDYFIKTPYPSTREGVLEKLKSEKLIRQTNGHYLITNLGALLFAKNLNDFDLLARKVVRVVQYKGKSKVFTLKEQLGIRGYAVGFQGLINYINALLPSNEEIDKALRSEVRVYPSLAIRELVANALIHQDFREKGTGPMIEIYEDRIEISNPGKPMVSTSRFIDEYQSRNEAVAAVMRRVGFCEEKGSGIDKVIFQAELYQLPAPDFQESETRTKALLFKPIALVEMNKKDKIRACYQHCCLCYVSNEKMTNPSLRNRFKIEDTKVSIASRIIRETMEAKLIKLEDPENKSRKHTRYIPWWA